MLLRRAAAVLTLSALVCGPSLAKETPAPVLDSEHEHPSGAFTFRTPASWTVRPRASNPDVLEAVGDDVLVRFLFRWGEIGYDGLHVDCMLERLAPPMDIQPRVEYEYDFLSGGFGPMRALDSAFTVTYDSPIRGQRQWRQHQRPNQRRVGRGRRNTRRRATLQYSGAWRGDECRRADPGRPEPAAQQYAALPGAEFHYRAPGHLPAA